jgi:hypothetical protein
VVTYFALDVHLAREPPELLGIGTLGAQQLERDNPVRWMLSPPDFAVAPAAQGIEKPEVIDDFFGAVTEVMRLHDRRHEQE